MMLSALIVCCIFLLTLFDLCKYNGKQYDPRSDCSGLHEQSDLGLHCLSKMLLFQQAPKVDDFKA